ncbi:uncharacterized protein LOC113753509 [Coffea eugenioides]|uniref:uncharacterized protein LOC113753509 n=1 Tax=Coffea eugenioides TaxID=49369 RepID=UPI000F60B02F|nr:uncharacterized protein LOC113753509 [Coffea eugenioides]
MEDVITDIPPPSRFFLEDLNIFTPPSPPLPSPFLLFSISNNGKPFRPSLLVVAISFPSLHFFHHVSSKKRIGTLILPEIPFSGNSVEPSLRDKSCDIYAINNADESIVVVSVQYPVTAERSHAVAKLLIGEQINPERVLILESVQSRNFRGKLSRDDSFAFKLETSLERSSKNSPLITGLDYLPSGSMVDGLAAALLAQCQLRKIRGSLCLSWPEFGFSSNSLIKNMLLKVLPGIELASNSNDEDSFLRIAREKDYLDSELYT